MKKIAFQGIANHAKKGRDWKKFGTKLPECMLCATDESFVISTSWVHLTLLSTILLLDNTEVSRISICFLPSIRPKAGFGVRKSSSTDKKR